MQGGDQLRLYSEWLDLTQAETRAIQATDWVQLSTLHSRKQDLQSAIVEAERSEGPVSTERADARQALLGELIRHESRNRDLIAGCRRAAEDDRSAIEQSRLNLRRLHRQLVGRPGAGWQCYS